jgi:hypothetical protein
MERAGYGRKQLKEAASTFVEVLLGHAPKATNGSNRILP